MSLRCCFKLDKSSTATTSSFRRQTDKSHLSTSLTTQLLNPFPSTPSQTHLKMVAMYSIAGRQVGSHWVTIPSSTPSPITQTPQLLTAFSTTSSQSQPSAPSSAEHSPTPNPGPRKPPPPLPSTLRVKTRRSLSSMLSYPPHQTPPAREVSGRMPGRLRTRKHRLTSLQGVHTEHGSGGEEGEGGTLRLESSEVEQRNATQCNNGSTSRSKLCTYTNHPRQDGTG
jgi:hypothetical protein